MKQTSLKENVAITINRRADVVLETASVVFFGRQQRLFRLQYIALARKHYVLEHTMSCFFAFSFQSIVAVLCSVYELGNFEMLVKTGLAHFNR